MPRLERCLQNSQENICVRDSILIKLQAQDCKKETLVQVFSCELCELSKNTFFTEQIWTTLAMTFAKRILQTQVVLGIFDYSTICLIDKLISDQCCLSYRNQSFDLHYKSNVVSISKTTPGLKGLNREKEEELLTKNFCVITEKPLQPS